MAEEGIVPRVVKGEIELLPAIRGMIEHYRKMAERNEITLEGEKVLKLNVERQLKELKLGICSGDLILKGDLPTLIAEREKAVKRGLDFLYRSLQKKLTGKDSRQMGEIIRVEVRKFFEKMSAKSRIRRKSEIKINERREKWRKTEG